MPLRMKTTLIFSGPQKGWSESYYSEPNTDSIAVNTARAVQMATARSGLLGVECAVKGLRVSVIENAAGEKITRVGDLTQNLNITGNATQNAAAPDLSLLVDCGSGDNRYHKLLYLGGIWDLVSGEFGRFLPQGAWMSVFNSFLAKIQEYGYGWLRRIPSLTYSVTAFEQTADGYVLFTMSADPFAGLPTNQAVKVRFSNLDSIGGTSLLNGDMMVKPLSNNTAMSATRIATLPQQNVGSMVKFTYAFEQIIFMSGEKIVSRERGSPLLESRGRRRARSRT